MKKGILIVGGILLLVIGYSFTSTTWKANKKDGDCAPPPTTQTCEPYNMVFNTNNQEFDFIYDVDTRFHTNVTKQQINHANTVLDLLPKAERDAIKSFVSLEVSTYNGVRSLETKARSSSAYFNQSQFDILQTLDYSSDFYVCGRVEKENTFGYIYYDTLIYYISVIPEQAASYKPGKAAMLEYLQKYSQDVTENVEANKLRPGRIRFKVNEEGCVDQVQLEESSGYESIDLRMIGLIKHMPGEWEAARNFNGEKVSQELVYSFGMVGC